MNVQTLPVEDTVALPATVMGLIAVRCHSSSTGVANFPAMMVMTFGQLREQVQRSTISRIRDLT
jgi:hypothetical protein